MSANSIYLMIPEERQPGFISLKEASERFGYSQDYLGQLIRKGKLEGKLVYSHVAWVTTEEAVQEYIDGGKKKRARAGSLEVETRSAEHEVYEEREETASFRDTPDLEQESSHVAKWLIGFFRVLLILAILSAMFVFYLLTTAFGEELHSGTLVARASVTINDQLHDNDHE